jgi:predicted MFS family arabinose efflux permease
LALGHGGTPVVTALLLCIALAAGFLFIQRERSTAYPLLEPSLLATPFHGLAVFNALLSFIVLFAVLILIPFYLDKVLGLQPADIGWVMTAVPLSVLPASPLAGRLHDRLGSIPVTASGLGLALAGILLLLRLGPESRPLDAALGLFVLGWGQATFLAPNSASVLGRVDEDDAGAMSGLLATARNLGMLLGITLSGLVFSRIYSWAGGGEVRDYTPEQVDAFMSALRGVLLLCALLSLLALVLALQRGKRNLMIREQGALDRGSDRGCSTE